ncbi:hypothetical protein D3C76_1352280 [compost metagenome]
MVQADQYGKHRRRQQHGAEQAHLALETVGEPGHEYRAEGAGKQEHRGNQVGVIQGQAAFQQQRGQPADHEVQKDQADEERRPDQQGRPGIAVTKQRHHGELVLVFFHGLHTGRRRLPAREHLRRELEQARIGRRVTQQAWQGFGQVQGQERKQQQRRNTASKEHRLPAETVDEPGSDETTGSAP